jgi:hypothetical protein
MELEDVDALEITPLLSVTPPTELDDVEALDRVPLLSVTPPMELDDVEALDSMPLLSVTPPTVAFVKDNELYEMSALLVRPSPANIVEPSPDTHALL